jgi:hypothetical protein
MLESDMPLGRLELLSSRDDQTIQRVSYVVHGTSNATDALSILDGGLRFTEGRPTFSTNIVHAHDWTINPQNQAQSYGTGTAVGEPGKVLVCVVPPNYHLGHGVFTSAYIDRRLRRVMGAPLRYAGARKQLALYIDPDTEAARVSVEAEVANGYPLNQHPQQMLERQYIAGSLSPEEGLAAVLTQLEVAIRDLEAVDFDRFAASLAEYFIPLTPSHTTAPEMLRVVVQGTVESIVMSSLRMMRWQGLALLGYSFVEGRQEINITPVADTKEQLSRIDEFGKKLASSELFSGELSWLKAYGANHLELMKVELEGAALESLTD